MDHHHDTAQLDGTSSAIPSDYHYQMRSMLPWSNNIKAIISPTSGDSKYTFAHM